MMLNREEIANWAAAPPCWTVTDEGMTVHHEGRRVVTIPPGTFPDLILRMAAALRKG